MDEIDWAAKRRELGIEKFAAWVKEPCRAAAWAAHLRREAAPAVAGWPLSVVAVPANGRGLALVTVPVGVPHLARVVSELVTVGRHWWANGESAVCFEGECQHCPSVRRVVEGYFDAILARRSRDDRTEIYRAIQCVPQAAVEWFEGRTIRGNKLSFLRRYAKSPTQVDIVESECEWELPPAIDVREPLKRRWQIPYWPGGSNAKEEGGPSEILKFRRQA